MKNNCSLRIFIYIISLVTIFGLSYRIHTLKKTLDGIESHTDTIVKIEHKIDTILIKSPVPVIKERLPIDSVKKTLEPFIPFEKRMYSDGKNYKLWMSGAYLSLDSIFVYKNIEYKTVTQREVVKVSDKKWGGYVFTGINNLEGGLYPCVGVAFASPKRWIFSFETGFNKKDIWYGVKIGYKINK